MATKVKQEPEDEAPEPPEPADVPPGVVLDKLEELLKSGRVMLRFQPPGSQGWAVNGKLGQAWNSFRVGPDGACEYFDDMPWATDGSDCWTESELEWLQRLRAQAEKLPLSTAKQPSAHRPRECRRAVFAYHRIEHAKRKKAASSAKAGSQGGKAPAAKAPVAKAPLAKAPVAKAPIVKAPEAKSPVAKTPAPKAPVAKAPVAKAVADADGPAVTAEADTVQDFLKSAKQRFEDAGRGKSYRELLGILKTGGDDQAVAKLLNGHGDLISRFRKLRRQSSGAGAGAGAGAGLVPEVEKRPKQPAFPPPGRGAGAAVGGAPAKPASVAWPVVNPEELVLKAARARSEDPVVRFVSATAGQRGVRAGLRLALLQYARTQVTDAGAPRQMVILRGPPGTGKTAYAAEELRMQGLGLLGDEEPLARLTHICSTADFLHRYGAQADAPDTPTFIEGDLTVSQLAEAKAKNEARVTLAVEAGLQPLYIDDSHSRLWEMAPYARLAAKAGYELSVVSPGDISSEWNSVDCLVERNSAAAGRSSAFTRSWLEAMVSAFETLEEEDVAKALLATTRGLGPAVASQNDKALAAAQDDAAQDLDAGESDGVAVAIEVEPAPKRPKPPGTAPPAQVMAKAKVAKATQPAPKAGGAKRPAPPSESNGNGASGAKRPSAAPPTGGGSAESKVATSLLASLRRDKIV